MIKGLITARQHMVFNAGEFLYAQVDTDGSDSFVVIIHMKEGVKVTAYMGSHEDCCQYLDSFELR